MTLEGTRQIIAQGPALVEFGGDGIGRQALEFGQDRPQRFGPRVRLIVIMPASIIESPITARSGRSSSLR